MKTGNTLIYAIANITLWLSACGFVEERSHIEQDRSTALEKLHQQTGASVALEIDEFQATRIVTIKPSTSISTHILDPGVAALSFLRANRAIFQLSDIEAMSFVVANIDIEHGADLRHVTLQRVY